jgi:hypothetical protein
MLHRCEFGYATSTTHYVVYNCMGLAIVHVSVIFWYLRYCVICLEEGSVLYCMLWNPSVVYIALLQLLWLYNYATA